MNKYEYVTATTSEEGDTVSVTATLPAYDPLKGIPMIRYDGNDAYAYALEKYGKQLGNLKSSNVVLENRRYPDKLTAKWEFSLDRPPRAKLNKPATSRRRRRTTTKNSE